jgi:hypothetical protein
VGGRTKSGEVCGFVSGGEINKRKTMLRAGGLFMYVGSLKQSVIICSEFYNMH